MKYGSITTGIIADGLVFNMDAANRASTIPSTSTLKTFNTLNTSISGSIITDATWEDGSPPTFDFDGSDGYIDFGDNDIFTFGNGTNDEPFSIFSWIKIFATTSQGIVTKYGSSTSLREWLFYTTGGKLRLLLWNGSTNNFATGTTTFSTDTWYNIACTYDGRGGSTAYNGINLYINSVLESVTTSGGSYTAMNNTSQPVQIATHSGGSFLNGNIGPTQIYNRALSANEVLHNYNALKGRFGL